MKYHRTEDKCYLYLDNNIKELLATAEQESRLNTKSTRFLILILKKVVALLHIDYKMKTKILSKMFPLSINQIKNAYANYRKGR